MNDQKLTQQETKVAEDSRYTEEEYRQVKDVAEVENRDPAEILDTTMTIALEARNHHRQAYKTLLQNILPTQETAEDVETLEHKFFDVLKR